LPKTGGKQKGTANKKTRELADEAARSGLTPLEVQLRTMTELWKRAHASGEMDVELATQACAIAKDCASYCHPRLSTIEAELTIEDRNNSAQLYEALSRMNPSERAAVKAAFALLQQRMLAPPAAIDVTNENGEIG
jgi:hypothetical protein